MKLFFLKPFISSLLSLDPRPNSLVWLVLRCAQSGPTLCIPSAGAHSALCPWGSQGRNTEVGCHFFLQGIFPTQGSNQYLLFHSMSNLTELGVGLVSPGLAGRRTLELSHQGSPQLVYLKTFFFFGYTAHGILVF